MDEIDVQCRIGDAIANERHRTDLELSRLRLQVLQLAEVVRELAERAARQGSPDHL